jgi:hypothetical protein
MPNRSKLLIAIGSMAAVGGLLSVLHLGKRESMYQGQSVSGWLTVYRESQRTNGDTAQRELAVAAIKAMGTNAFPVLLRHIAYETPSWLTFVGRRLPGPIAMRIFKSRFVRASVFTKVELEEAAREILPELGTNALSTMPKLTMMMQDGNHPQVAIRAAHLLSRMGLQGFHMLVSALDRTNQPFRAEIVNALAIGSAPVVGTNLCLPRIKAALEDQDPIVRIVATNSVAYLTKTQNSGSGTQ